MSLEDRKAWGEVHRDLPGSYSNAAPAGLRATHRGELVTKALDRNQLCDEGSYYLAQNATIDAATTLAGHAAPVLADLYTKAFLFMRCNETAATAKRMYLDVIHIQVITAGANGTSDNWAAECDTGATRLSSGGTDLTVVNTNMQSSGVSAATVKGGAAVLAAATTSQRKMGHGVFRPSIAITGDKYTFKFGQDWTENNVVASAATHHIIAMPPVILGPTDQFALHLYAPSQSVAGVYKLWVGWWER